MGVSMKFTDLDQYLFGQGTNYEVYKKLGAHPTTYRRKKGVYFAVWAPNAQSVSVIGEFNDWEEEANPMEKFGPIGVYEVFVPGAKIGQLYKFFIVGAHGEKLYKADPSVFVPSVITAPPSPHADAVSAKQTASMARYIFFFIIINTPFYIPGTGVGLEESHTSDTSKRSLSISGL